VAPSRWQMPTPSSLAVPHGSAAWPPQMRNFDQTGPLWLRGGLTGKVGPARAN
jgi:hypothetical protein